MSEDFSEFIKQAADLGFEDPSLPVHCVYCDAGEEGDRTNETELREKLSRAICSSAELRTLEVPPRPFLIGQWFREGDLGFVYAQRGVGKSWFALDMAAALAEKRPFGPWEVHVSQRVLYLDGEMPLDEIKQRDARLAGPNPNLEYINHSLLYDRSGLVMNLANFDLQQAIVTLCLERKISVLVLDNLSTLVSGADENKGTDWERLQPWLLQLRRERISVVFVHHSGRDAKYMRGHSKREDPAFWIIRLDRPAEIDSLPGAKFIVRFTKWRNVTEVPKPREWHYRPEADRILLTTKDADILQLFRAEVEKGNGSASDIADELDVSKGWVAKLANKGEQEGWLEKLRGGKYRINNRPH